MAEEITFFVHGKEELEKALETTGKLFSQQTASAQDLTKEDLEQMDGIVKIDFPNIQLKQGIDVVSFLASSQILPSKGEAKKMIQNGGVSVNKNKVDSLQLIIDESMLLHNQYLLIQKGKKNYYLVKVI